MYEQYWDLQCPPFDSTLDERFFFAGQSHRVCLAKLDWALHRRHAAALLSGGFGIGKTMLIHMLRRQLPDGFAPVVHVVFPPSGAPSLLGYLAEELAAGDAGSAPEAMHTTLRRLTEFFEENARRERHALLVVDEAHLLQDSATLEAMRMLTNFHLDGRPVLTLVLVGQPALLSTVSRLPHLDSRLAAKCLLCPFSQSETSAYVDHRLEAAGAQRMIFQPEAMLSIHALSGGVPRLINRLCDLALLLASTEGSSMVEASHIERVGVELSPSAAAS